MIMLNPEEPETVVNYNTTIKGGIGGDGGDGGTLGGRGGVGEGASMTNNVNTNSFIMNNWIGLDLDSLLAGFLNIGKESTGADAVNLSLLEQLSKEGAFKYEELRRLQPPSQWPALNQSPSPRSTTPNPSSTDAAQYNRENIKRVHQKDHQRKKRRIAAGDTFYALGARRRRKISHSDGYYSHDHGIYNRATHRARRDRVFRNSSSSYPEERSRKQCEEHIEEKHPHRSNDHDCCHRDWGRTKSIQVFLLAMCLITASAFLVRVPAFEMTITYARR
ncbi:hypothetical protein R3P38DRAFT_2827859 [Favolaschia claudopus]|uniref:Uncharacterized protein n=1 Tax=Favolaschia claudopus TaxID=2862362 RepID=A0AAW0EKS3_9AGAR